MGNPLSFSILLTLLSFAHCEEVEVSFTKGAYIVISNQRLPSNHFRLEVRFKTFHPNGVLLYTQGRNGHYIALTLNSGMVRIMIGLTSSQLDETLYKHPNVCDGRWHLLKLTQNTETKMNINFDNQKYRYTVQGKPDIGVHTCIAGIDHTIPNLPQKMTKLTSFEGCMSKASINGKNALLARNNKNYKYSGTIIAAGCITNTVVGFNKRPAFLKIKPTVKRTLKISFSLRTYTSHGKLLQTQVGDNLLIKMFLKDGRLLLNLRVILGGTNELYPFIIRDKIADGDWHDIKLTVQGNKSLMFKVDKKAISWRIPRDFKTISMLFQTVIVGSGGPDDGFIGCLNHIMVNGKNLRQVDYTQTGVTFTECPLLNHCHPNPCKNRGVCVDYGTYFMCKCKDHFGLHCSLPLYRSTCHEYFKLGLSSNSSCLIDPDQNGTLTPFQVVCKIPGNHAVTIVQNKQGGKYQTPYNNNHKELTFQSTMHSYTTSVMHIKALIARSRRCRQYLTFYNISQSMTSGLNTAFWISVKGNRGPIPFTGEGYLTERSLLPVVGVQYKPHLSYYLGPLECFGTKKRSHPLPPKVNIVRLLETVCKPWVHEDDDYIEENITTIDVEKKRDVIDTTTTNRALQTIITTTTTTTATTALLTALTSQHLTTAANPVTNQGFVLWYIAVIVVGALVFLSVMFIVLLVKVKRYTKKQGVQQLRLTAERLPITDEGLPLESDLWMKVNTAGYDVKTGTITYGEMYGSFR